MKNKAFTLAEVLVTLTVLVVLFAGLIVLINPAAILQRGFDITRKKDLDDAKKMMEEYMADTGCYPQPTQVCTEGNNNGNCHICTRGQSPKFSYFSKDICDPKHGASPDYLYQPESVFVGKVGVILAHTAVTSCPKWFRLLSVIDSPYNKADDLWNCGKGGCGAAPQYGYSYVVTSPGAPIDNVSSPSWFCYLRNGEFGQSKNDCVNCTPYDNCTAKDNPCFGRKDYPLRQTCCTENGVSPCN